jgi:Tol biopolymer transport system component
LAAVLVFVLVALEVGSRPAPAHASSPAISNGKIAFDARRDCCDEEIFAMNAGGSDSVQLTENESADDSPDWSPGLGAIRRA